MGDLKSIVWGLVFLLLIYLWISGGCQNRFDEFRQRRKQWREDRQEQRRERDDSQRETIFDRWKNRRESAVVE